jgi:hypothetical protein
MDVKGGGEKIAWFRISHCESDVPAVAIGEVQATQAQNQRAKSDKTYHLVVSLPPGEELSREQAADIEDSICAGLGFEEHQRISAVHQDTDCWHLHMAINKIHPKTFRCVEPFYPYYKLDTLAKELEIKHGLTQANRIGKGKSFAKVGDMEAHQQEESFLRWLHEGVGGQLAEAVQKAQGWQDIHDLLIAGGAEIKPKGAGLAIVSLDGTVGIKASSLDRQLSYKSLTKRFGEYQPPGNQEEKKQYRDAKIQERSSEPPVKANQGKSFTKVGGLEAHQQEESFLRWLHESVGGQLAEALQKAQGWQDIHELLIASGAEIKPRGAGLAIVTLDGTVGIKASLLDRKLSYKALTERFGEYQPHGNREEKKQYQLGVKKPPGANSLYAEYKKAKEVNYQAKTKAQEELRVEHSENRVKLKERYRERRAVVKSNTQMNGKTKRVAYQELSVEMKADFARRRQIEMEQKKAICEKFPAETWDAYLIRRAEEGHTEALSVLRKRLNYRKQINQALLTVENVEDARDVIKPHFMPTVQKNGKVIYRVADGGVVTDEQSAISVSMVTEAAALLALSLAEERFSGKALIVEGTDEFKLQIVKFSTLHGLSIHFADPVLEKERERHVRAKTFGQEAGRNDVSRGR